VTQETVSQLLETRRVRRGQVYQCGMVLQCMRACELDACMGGLDSLVREWEIAAGDRVQKLRRNLHHGSLTIK